LKVYATTRAYENASEVGIASPDVLCFPVTIQDHTIDSQSKDLDRILVHLH